MGVISVRLNKDEDKILRQLSGYFHVDRSTLIKKSLVELYENMKDIEMIEAFEKKEKRGKVFFISAEDILGI
ncbi:MAG: hypothetical protein CVV37_07545 [Nitrospira bacterium HGW-Nitrospira-1]|nr:MAG: hypothetical protein CVV37_07545 [Nitrospira bacterium HGW-Nitrospira-1]